jgi:hypothetical protein
MVSTCGACGRVCETRYDRAHHGCEVAGARREANQQAGTPPAVTPAEPRATRAP